MVPPVRAVCIAIVALSLAACQGYWEAPVQIREQLDAALERVDLYPGAVGTIQLRIDAPDDSSGPLWLVGNPEILSQDPSLTAIGWAYGPCKAWPQPADAFASEPPLETATSLRLCVAVYSPPYRQTAPFYLGAVVDSRLEGRRFTAAVEVVSP